MSAKEGNDLDDIWIMSTDKVNEDGGPKIFVALNLKSNFVWRNSFYCLLVAVVDLCELKETLADFERYP